MLNTAGADLVGPSLMNMLTDAWVVAADFAVAGMGVVMLALASSDETVVEQCEKLLQLFTAQTVSFMLSCIAVPWDLLYLDK